MKPKQLRAPIFQSVANRGAFWIKVGQTKRAGLKRVKKQLNTPFPGLEGITVLFRSEEATRPYETNFTDHAVRYVLRIAGFANGAGEWFEATTEGVRGAIVSLQNGSPFSSTRSQNCPLRMEQEEAIAKTHSYFKAESATEPTFLWKAKMRSGKTITTYKLSQSMGWNRALILTDNPAIRSAQKDAFLNRVDFSTGNSSTPLCRLQRPQRAETARLLLFDSPLFKTLPGVMLQEM